MATTTQQSISDQSSPRRHRRLGQSASNDAILYRSQQATGFTIIEQAQQGVAAQQVDQLSQLLTIPFKKMAGLLQIAERTLHRFRSEGHLDQQASERFLLLENLTAHGLLVFDGRADALLQAYQLTRSAEGLFLALGFVHNRHKRGSKTIAV